MINSYINSILISIQFIYQFNSIYISIQFNSIQFIYQFNRTVSNCYQILFKIFIVDFV